MIFARDENGGAIEARRDARGVAPMGFCPCCGKPLQARVGEIRRPHWAHESGERCDEWWEEESEWSLGWIERLKQFPLLDLQNTLEKNGSRHFYDIKDASSRMWLFRRSRLPVEQVAQREQFFEKMLWFVGACETEYEKFNLERQRWTNNRIAPCSYYYGGRRTGCFFARWADCTRPVFFDFSSVSKGKETTLWCVLRGPESRYFILEFRREDFFNRLQAGGKLFKEETDAVLGKLVVFAQNYFRRPLKKEPYWRQKRSPARKLFRPSEFAPGLTSAETEVLPPVETDVCPATEITNELSEKVEQVKEEPSFEQIVAQYEKLGFSHADAVARAKIETS